MIFWGAIDEHIGQSNGCPLGFESDRPLNPGYGWKPDLTASCLEVTLYGKAIPCAYLILARGLRHKH